MKRPTRSIGIVIPVIASVLCACGGELAFGPEDERSVAGSNGARGLKGTYFDNMDLTARVLQRVDASIDFEWGRGSPESRVGANSFSVRWEGFVTARHSERYSFHTISDDGVRLWVDGKLIVDDWNNHPPVERTGSVKLEAEKSYPIKLEYYENGGGAVMRLLWSSPSQAKAVIPAAQLSTTRQSGSGPCSQVDENRKATLSCPAGKVATQGAWIQSKSVSSRDVLMDS